MTTYDDPAKEIAWQSFWKGYTKGYGVEEMKPINRQTAMGQFERWWDVEMNTDG